MATEKKYQGIPPLSTIKHLDPNLRKVLLPIWSYVNAQMSATGAKPPVKADLNINDILSGFINSRTIGDGAVKTLNVLEDAITRAWGSFGLVSIDIPDYDGAIPYSNLVTIPPFIATDKPLIMWIFLEFYFSSVDASTPDKLHFITDLYRDLVIVRKSRFKWTQSTADADEYFLTDEEGHTVIANPDEVYESYVKLIEVSSGTALAAGQWKWANNDTLDGNTIYVRLIGSTNPVLKTDGYLLAGYKQRRFYSEYFTGYMMYDNIGLMPQSYFHHDDNPGTEMISYHAEATNQMLVGALGSRSVVSRQNDLFILEKKR